MAVPDSLIAKAAKRSLQRAKYGNVRPIIHADNWGLKFVVVGNEVHWSKSWKTFPDFLIDYIRRVMNTNGWGKRELAKPLEERHPILQWFYSLCEHQSKMGGGENGLIRGSTTGPSRALMQLAYDLYVLRDSMVLQETLVRRLKDPNQFQGARYELIVAAAFIRAGYDIRHEDESDSSSRHPEFVATHRQTKVEVDVEAKSKHRTGVLGFKSPEANNHANPGDVRWLLKDAAGKFRNRPFLVFVDLNLPPAGCKQVHEERCQELHDMLISSHSIRNTRGDIFNLLAFTNFPSYYDRDSAYVLSDDAAYFLVPDKPICPIVGPDILQGLLRSVNQVGHIPNDFE